MKKQLLAIIGLLITVIIGLLYCKNSPQRSNGNSFCTNAKCNTYDGTALEGTISYLDAKSMSEAYAMDPGKKFINSGKAITAQQDARSIWFDLNKIKKYIAYIENFACKQNCPDSMQFGIRMFYAKYSGNAEVLERMGVPLAYANMHTLFMVPTYKNPQTGTNENFDPAGSITNCRPVRIDSIKGRLFGGFAGEPTDNPDAENHGGLRPPPDNSGTFQ